MSSKCVMNDQCSSFRCDCSEHFEGEKCQWLKEPCTSDYTDIYFPSIVRSEDGDICHNGRCLELYQTILKKDGRELYSFFKCECTDCFYGDQCDQHACDDVSCGNGVCKTSLDCYDVFCDCDENYTGEFCELIINHCHPAVNTCENRICYTES